MKLLSSFLEDDIVDFYLLAFWISSKVEYQLEGIGRTDLEGGSSAQMADSLRKLAQLPIPRETQVLPGHGEFSIFGAELDNNYYIRSALRGGNDIF